MFNHIGSTLASLDWDELIKSMHQGFDGTVHATKLLVGIGVLVLILINIRLARWLAKFSVHKG